VSLSISTSFWSDSEELFYLDGIKSKAVPMDKSWTRVQQAVALQQFLAMLLPDTVNCTANQFIQQLVANRYSALFNASMLQTDLIPVTCHASDTQFLNATVLSEFSAVSAEVRTLFLSLFAVSNDPSILNIVMGNYVEYLAVSNLGVESVAPFLYHCFR
jgi:hypothetical protein